MGREQTLRELAYAIWESKGHPEGCADEHWHQAETQMEANVAQTKKTQNKLAPRKAAKEIAKVPMKKADDDRQSS
jgi:Protein of unknown function (DUF2934)